MTDIERRKGERPVRIFTCGRCGSDFGSNGSPSRTRFCPPCRGPAAREREKNWRETDAGRSLTAARQRRRRAKNGHGINNHGISTDEYLGLYRAQAGLCAVCRIHRPPEWVRGNLELDHCHLTGEVRALICGNCNTAAGRVGDDPAVLRALADYLETRHTGLVVRR